MLKLLVAVLFAATLSPAYADKAQADKAPAAALFEIDHLDSRADTAQQSVSLWSTGAWTFTETTSGKTTSTATGKLDADALKRAKADLAAAKWTTTSQIHCMVATSTSTVYKVNGAAVFTDRVCNGSKLDDASQKSLKDLNDLLAPAWPKTDAAGSAATPKAK